ncbi:pentapeptide repeat-containing protein [Streptomyces katsurahamanus]|nr:pentapeptide repeat-containing protein [Streptomyces katsurahamanus]
MITRTIRRTSVTLPSVNEPGLYLSNISSLEGGRGRIAEFQYADTGLRDLDLADTHLMDGRITGLTAQRTRFDRLRVDSVEFTGCDLSSLQWSDSKISRVVFTGCKLMGASLDGLTLDHVVFEDCRLDYCTFAGVQAKGPVIFSRCSLREATFTGTDLGSGLFADCDLRLTEFDTGGYRDLDLRGNDLSQVRGVGALQRVIVNRSQTLQLAEALAAELELTYGEDPDSA